VPLLAASWDEGHPDTGSNTQRDHGHAVANAHDASDKLRRAWIFLGTSPHSGRSSAKCASSCFRIFKEAKI
jgi:hypothetical protein